MYWPKYTKHWLDILKAMHAFMMQTDSSQKHIFQLQAEEDREFMLLDKHNVIVPEKQNYFYKSFNTRI